MASGSALPSLLFGFARRCRIDAISSFPFTKKHFLFRKKELTKAILDDCLNQCWCLAQWSRGFPRDSASTVCGFHTVRHSTLAFTWWIHRGFHCIAQRAPRTAERRMLRVCVQRKFHNFPLPVCVPRVSSFFFVLIHKENCSQWLFEFRTAKSRLVFDLEL